jgi:hypothetical protein
MQTFLYFITACAVVVGVGVSIWSFLDTNRRYPRKRKRAKPD